MRVLVTGAAGLLGRWVAKRLLARGDSVIAVDSLSRYEMMGVAAEQRWPAELEHERCLKVHDSFYSSDVFALMREEAPDAIVHAAAQTSHPRSIEIPAADFEVNAVGTVRLLEFLRAWHHGRDPAGYRAPEWRTLNAPRLVFVSSAKVYGETVSPKFSDLIQLDKRLDLGATLKQYERDVGHAFGVNECYPLGDQTMLTPFGISKAAADMYCQVYAKLYGLDIAILRPGCFTGPGSLATEAQNWAPLLVRAMVRGETLPVYGFGGKQVRDLLHVDDLARAVIACVDGQHLAIPDETHDEVNYERIPWRGEVFNVSGGSGRDVSILEAVDLIEKITGKRGELRHELKRAGDWPWFIGSNRKITEAIDWKPEITLEQTFRELCEEALHA